MRSPEFRKNTDRLIAAALRAEQDEPPEGFAAQTTAFVLRAPADRLGDRFESWAQWVVLLVLTGVAAATLLWSGGRVLVALASIDGAGWVYAGFTCGILSLAFQYLMQRWERRI
jgi:hypothetical protein